VRNHRVCATHVRDFPVLLRGACPNQSCSPGDCVVVAWCLRDFRGPYLSRTASWCFAQPVRAFPQGFHGAFGAFMVLSWCFHGALRLPGLFPYSFMVLSPRYTAVVRRVWLCFYDVKGCFCASFCIYYDTINLLLHPIMCVCTVDIQWLNGCYSNMCLLSFLNYVRNACGLLKRMRKYKMTRI
jgi:hypothetical protein